MFNRQCEQGDSAAASVGLTNNVQSIYTICEMARIVEMRRKCIILVLAFESLRKLDLFWKYLMDGEIQRRLKSGLITEELLKKFSCIDIDISIDIDEKQYEKARAALGI